MEDAGEEEDGEEEEEGDDDFRSSFPRFEDDIVSFVFVNGKEGEGMEEQEGRRGGRRAGGSWKRRRATECLTGLFSVSLPSNWEFVLKGESFENAFCIVFRNAFCILVL